MKKRILILVIMLITVITLSGCTAKEKAAYNISREADEFRVVRRVVFYNSITDTYMMEMVGNIAIDIDRDGIIEVIAKVSPTEYQKHYLGLSDNVTYTVEQLGVSEVSEYKYKIIFKPESILPIELEYKNGLESVNGVVQ